MAAPFRHSNKWGCLYCYQFDRLGISKYMYVSGAHGLEGCGDANQGKEEKGLTAVGSCSISILEHYKYSTIFITLWGASHTDRVGSYASRSFTHC